MGFNSTYILIYRKNRLDTHILSKTLIEYAQIKNIKFVEEKYLDYKKWDKNKTLFSIALTPLECYSLEGSNISKNWILINYTSLPKAFLGWEEYLSDSLQTFIEIHNVYDSVNQYTVTILGNKALEEPSANGIEWYVAQNYYDLKKIPKIKFNR